MHEYVNERDGIKLNKIDEIICTFPEYLSVGFSSTCTRAEHFHRSH